MTKSSLDFYKNLTAFSDEKDIFNEAFYHKLPEDWYIIISDVKASTKAIEEGYYKDVNTIGVASIIAVKNACGDTKIPFIFGGDGAIIFVPPQKVELAKKAITVSKKKAAEQFNLDLRISIIPAIDIYKSGGELFISKMKLSSSATIAMAKGNGIALAEDLTKKTNLYALNNTHSDFPDAHVGFVCRFEAIKSQNGEILSLIIQVIDNKLETYADLLSQINKISNHINLESNINTIKYSDINTYKEIKLNRTGVTKFLMFFFTSFMMHLFVFIQKLRQKAILELDDLTKNTDQLKFDNMLRTIVDVNPAQKNQIIQLLSTMYEQNKIYYGLHASESALMTCYVGSSTDHMHFIDGDSGGYAAAAIQLKAMRTKAKIKSA